MKALHINHSHVGVIPCLFFNTGVTSMMNDPLSISKYLGIESILMESSGFIELWQDSLYTRLYSTVACGHCRPFDLPVCIFQPVAKDKTIGAFCTEMKLFR